MHLLQVKKVGNVVVVVFVFFRFANYYLDVKNMKPDAPTDYGEGKDNCLFGLRFKLLIRIPDMM